MTGQLRNLITTAFVLAALAVEPAAAHPHVFVEGSATLDFDAGHKVSRVTVRYTLDEMTTAGRGEGREQDGNGLFERDERYEDLTTSLQDVQRFMAANINA